MDASHALSDTCIALQSYRAYPIRRCAYAQHRAGLAALLEAPPTAAPAVGTAALAQQLAEACAALTEMRQVAAAKAEAAESAQAELRHVAAAATAEAEAHARTRADLATALRRTADLERVVGELARSREGDALDRRVHSWSEAAREAQEATAHACAALAAQQRQFSELHRNCTAAILRLQATADIDGGASDQAAAANAVLLAQAAAAARSETAYWQAAVHDARFEARQHGLQLQRAGEDCERLEAALEAARAELAQEREQAKQASYRRWSSGSYAAAASKQAAADAEHEASDSDTIHACWEVTLEVAEPATPTKPTHRRSVSMVLC